MSLEAIRASAGSGKTYALTTRYLRTYRAGGRPEDILATTFTRKAAGEILGRIMKRLAEAAADNTGELAAVLSRDLDGPPLTTLDCRNLLVSLCRRLHRVSVSTIDSFFATLLDAFRLHSGVPFGLLTVGGNDASVTQARREALSALAERIGTDALLEFIERIHRGQVKTTISTDLDELIRDIFEVYRTSNDAAWRTLRHHAGHEAIDVSTAISALIGVSQTISHKPFEKALLKDIEYAQSDRWHELLESTLLDKVRIADLTYSKKEIPSEIRRAYVVLTEHATAVVISQLATQTEATADLLGEFTKEFETARKRHGVLTFSDVPYILAPIVAQSSLGEMSARLDVSIAHLLLDEFQDTAPVQWQILKPLAAAIAAPQHPGSFFCVGDTKQSIYGWRGAVPEIFASLDSDIAGIVWDDSNMSFRSSEHILDAVNKVFGELQGNWAISKYPNIASRWHSEYIHHTANKTLPGYVELLAIPNDADASADDATDEPDNSRFAYEARRILSIANAAPRCTVGVLMRKNKSVAAMISVLRGMGLEASDEGGNSLDGEPAVELILSAMTLADHPGDSASAYHVLKSPLRDAISMTEPLDYNTLSASAAGIRNYLASDGYAAVVSDWAKRLATHTSARGARKLVQLIDLAGAFDSKATLRPSDFVNFVRTTQVDDTAEARIRVMSIHKSKGLEFDIVVLPELDGKVPAIEPTFLVDRESPVQPIRAVYRNPTKAIRAAHPELDRVYSAQIGQEIRESLCTLYVAMTRARYALHMFVPKAELSLNPDKPPVFVPGNVVRLALTGAALPLSDGAERLYSDGTENWYGQLNDQYKLPLSTSPDKDAEPTKQRDTAIMPTRFLPRIIPSRLENSGIITFDALIQPDRAVARQFGRAIHTLFANIGWLTDPAPSDVELLDSLVRNIPSQEESWYSDQIMVFKSLLQKQSVRESLAAADLASGERVEVWRERNFVVHLGDRLVEGIFDRVVVVYRGTSAVRATVVDFKTDNVPAEAVPYRSQTYRPQVDAYRKALSSLLYLPEAQITATLLFVLPDISILVA